MSSYHLLFIKNLLGTLLLPPLSLFLSMLGGLWLLPRKPRLGKLLLGLGLLPLVLLSTPLVADRLMRLLEHDIRPVSIVAARNADAIVILGAEVYHGAPEYAGGAVGPLTLARLQYGAYLHRQTGLPILVTGGTAPPAIPVGILMKQTLERDFRVPVRWVEAQSRDTTGNAELSARILKPAGVRRVLVVSHAWHLPRARIAFERAGLIFIPAPTRFGDALPELAPDLSDFVPRAQALLQSHYALHELLGVLWYRFSR